MSEESQESRGLIDVNALPEPVRRMAEVMHGPVSYTHLTLPTILRV